MWLTNGNEKVYRLRMDSILKGNTVYSIFFNR